MSESSVDSASSSPLAAPRARAWAPWLVAAIAVGLGGAASWLAWRQAERVSELEHRLQGAGRQTQEQLSSLADTARAMQAGSASLDRRIADLEGINRSLREEVLGLGERAKLMEDAVARIADRRLSGAVMLRVNEAEYLLRLGQVRLRLFGDAAATTEAFRMADEELAALDDPLFAGVRQTIAAEIEALAGAPQIDREALVGRLDEISDLLPALPARGAPSAQDLPRAPADSGWFDRAGAVLAQFVRIREQDPSENDLLNPLHVEAARSALAVELAVSKAALLDRDTARARDSLLRTRAQLAAYFAPGDARVAQAIGIVDQIASAPLDAALPDVGRALEELRNLRATRALADRAHEDAATQAQP